MRHFLQYHKRGPLDTTERVDIDTKKSVQQLRGNRVWLICGDGDPRQYSLCGTFIVTEIQENQEERNRAWGSDERWLEHPVEIDKDAGWFKSLLARTANFSTGLYEIKDPVIIEELQKLHDGMPAPRQNSN